MSKETSDLDERIFGKEKLPEMLNVLTIMTLGYSSLMFISGIVNFFMLPGMLEDIQDKMTEGEVNFEEIENPFIQGLVKSGLEAIDYFPELNLLQIGVAVLCILAAILMRKLKRTGFYLYSFAVVVEIVIPILLVGIGVTAGLVLIGSFFSIIFVILYGVNIKHLK